MSAALSALLGRVLSARAGEKVLDYVGAAAGGYVYERLLLYAGGTAVQVPGWKQYLAAGAAAAADLLAGEIPGLHGLANGVIGALVAHYQLVKDISKAAPRSARTGRLTVMPMVVRR